MAFYHIPLNDRRVAGKKLVRYFVLHLYIGELAVADGFLFNAETV
jgi:hypothetical protein